jgi:membrane-associated phospholipid phosphatase
MASDNLKKISEVSWIVTVLLAPSGDEIGKVLTAKVKGTVVELVALSTTRGMTGFLRYTTQREHPSGIDKESFPSDHVSGSFSYTSLTRTNLEWFDMNINVRRAQQYGLVSVATGAGWARVDAGAHYPSDVLFGAALGNFLSVFFTRAFLGVGNVYNVKAGLTPVSGGAKFYIYVIL